MPIIPNVVERSLLRLNQLPGPLLDVLGTVVFRAVGAALNLGIFEALAQGPATAAELGQRTACSAAGIAQLLDLLAAAGYVREENGRFRNTASVTRWLLRSSPQSIVDFISLWQIVAFDQWNDLEASLRAGQPVLHMHDWLSRRPDGWPTFNAAMRAAAGLGAEEVARRTRLPAGARRLLDVGGSHALFSLAFCRRYPQLSATIFDLPEALPSARQTIADHGMAERIATQPGEMTQGDFGSGWDVILLFNVIHYFDLDQNAALARKAAAALNPNGQVVILDQLADFAPLPAAAAFVKALSLQYFATLGGRVYRSDEIAAWLAAAGFAPPRRIALRRTPGAYLLIAARTA